MNLTIAEILEAVNGKLLFGEELLTVQINEITTDSREIQEGMFFIPLKGERFDGHDFILDCFAKGAIAAFTDREIPFVEGRALILVDDTLKAMHRLATYYRHKFSIPFIAVTGSVGKTTTKEMLASVLTGKYNVLWTHGNFNNEIGLPLTIFRLREEHQIAVVEMGMSGLGEIERLAKMAAPFLGVVTNIGISHIEKLGSQQNILKAKMELFSQFGAEKIALLNGDDLLLYGQKGKLQCRTCFYGIYNQMADIRATDITYHGENGASFTVQFEGGQTSVAISSPGEHSIYNTLAAIATGLYVGLTIPEIMMGLSRYKPEKMRMNIYEVNGIKVIDDCYNASVASMNAALHVLGEMNSSRKIAILSDMLELGDFSEDAHLSVGVNVVRKQIDYLICIGDQSRHIVEGALSDGMKEERVFYFEDREKALTFVKQFLRRGDAILVKGSRGMKLEQFTSAISEVSFD